VADGLPRLPDAQDRARLANQVSRPDITDVRDLALILNLYWGAFRGSELVAMTWSDVRVVDRGVEMESPACQERPVGKGRDRRGGPEPQLPSLPGGGTRRAALRLRRALGARAAGRRSGVHPPRPPALGARTDHPRWRAQVVKRTAAAARLDGNYASHSLRAGFVTDALDAGATREQVQRHGRWTNIRSGGLHEGVRKCLLQHIVGLAKDVASAPSLPSLSACSGWLRQHSRRPLPVRSRRHQS